MVLENGTTAILSEDDLDAIDALRDDCQAEANAGISAAHDACERRRFLNETARELFRDLLPRVVDPKMGAAELQVWSACCAKIASEAAGELLYEVERIAADLKKNTGMEVA